MIKKAILVGSKENKIDLLSGTKAYANLSQIVNNEGILQRDYLYYASLATVSFCAFFLSLFLIIVSESLWSIAFLSTVFAFFTVQVAGLVHDSGHRAIFKSTKFNDYFGHFCATLVAIPYTNWKIRHNKHHASPNEEDEDPDISFPIISFTTSGFQKKRGVVRFLTKYQAYIYYPLLTLSVFGERNFSFLFSKNDNKLKDWEKVLFVAGVLTWFVLPFLVFDLSKALVFFLTTNLLIGFYIGNIFAPNHKGMPEIKKGAKISFLEQQIITTRNIKSNWLTDFIYLGLNYQMEHHLFPNCPRNKLKLITPHLKKLCKNLDLEFTVTSVVQSNQIILRELRTAVQLA